MTGMAGLEFRRHLRRGLLNPTILIIILTSLHQISNKIEGMQVGADDYVTKLFDPQEFVTRVVTHMPLSERDSRTSPLTRLPGIPAAVEEVSHQEV
jgi:DNA-binding response OmpR family regulator